MNIIDDTDISNLYHEKQILGRCAIHAVNNLFQSKWLTYDDMCNISLDLYSSDNSTGALINPYKSPIPYWGQFDIQCIIKVIDSRSCEVTDHLLKISDIQAFDFYSNTKSIKGLIINIQESFLFNTITSNHWYSVLKLKDVYIDLNSNLINPVSYTNKELFIKYLESVICTQYGQIFVICNKI